MRSRSSTSSMSRAPAVRVGGRALRSCSACSAASSRRSRCARIFSPASSSSVDARAGEDADQLAEFLLLDVGPAFGFGDLALDRRALPDLVGALVDSLADDLLGDVGANADSARTVANRRAAIHVVALAALPVRVGRADHHLRAAGRATEYAEPREQPLRLRAPSARRAHPLHLLPGRRVDDRGMRVLVDELPEAQLAQVHPRREHRLNAVKAALDPVRAQELADLADGGAGGAKLEGVADDRRLRRMRLQRDRPRADGGRAGCSGRWACRPRSRVASPRSCARRSPGDGIRRPCRASSRRASVKRCRSAPLRCRRRRSRRRHARSARRLRAARRASGRAGRSRRRPRRPPGRTRRARPPGGARGGARAARPRRRSSRRSW